MNAIYKYSFSLLFILPQYLFAQSFNDLRFTLALNNPAYHPDHKIHGKGYVGSDLMANTGIFFSTGSKYVLYQNFLRYQMSLGKWKVGVNASNLNYVGQHNLELGLSLGRDFQVNRDLNFRIAATGFQRSGFIDGSGQINSSYGVQIGAQANYKDWSFYSSAGSNGFNMGATNRFDLDSTQHFLTTVYYEHLYGFQKLSANVNYQYRGLSLLIGGAYRSYLMGAGYQFKNGHSFMLSSKWERNLLSTGQQLNLQLGYHFSLTHRPTARHFTGTPSF